MFHFKGYNEFCEDFDFIVPTLSQALAEMRGMRLFVVWVFDLMGVDVTDMLHSYDFNQYFNVKS